MICDTCNKINRAYLPLTQEEKDIREFCKKIPKDPTEDISNFEVNDLIYTFAKGDNILEPTKKPEDHNWEVKELQTALKSEMEIMKYLMKKHKNRRAASFAKNILYPTITKLSEILEEQLEKNKVSVSKNNKFAQYGSEDSRQIGIKKYCNEITKNYSDFLSQKDKLVENLGEICMRGDNRTNDFVQTLNNAHEIIDELVNNHKHTRFLHFSEIFDEVVDKTIKNVETACKQSKENKLAK